MNIRKAVGGLCIIFSAAVIAVPVALSEAQAKTTSGARYTTAYSRMSVAKPPRSEAVATSRANWGYYHLILGVGY
jgi:hypothetical protein